MKKYTQLLYCLVITISINHSYAANEKAPWVGKTLNGLSCTGKPQGIGPFDYNNRVALGKEYKMIVRSHFTHNVKYLISGNRGYLWGDLDYTLRAIPNHPEAILSVIRYEIKRTQKYRTRRLGKLKSQPECYIQRAINFRKKDPVPYFLYGYYLRKLGGLTQAVQYYEKALNLAPQSSKIEYSFSLLLIDLKRYDEALNHAKKAYKLGKPPSGLRNKLIKLKVWN